MPIKISLKQLGLFSFLVALAISCKKPEETLGDQLQPESDLLYAFQTDSFHLEAQTFKKEKTRIDVFANFMVGNYVDEDFGSVKCDAIFQLAPSNTQTAPRYDEDLEGLTLIVDSAVLQLSLQSEAYGKNAPMYFNLNELVNEIHIDSAYYSDIVINKKPENLIYPGREWQHPMPENIDDSDSSLFFNIRLKNDFAEDLFFRSPLNNFSNFRDFLHGLVLSTGTTDARVLSLNASGTKISLYYHTSANPSVPNVTTNLVYELVYTSSCESFTKIDYQYTNSPLSSLAYGAEVDGSEVCYAQSGSSTRIRVDISDVLRLQHIPTLSINKAELIIPYDMSSKFEPLSRVLLTYSNDEDSYLRTADSAYVGGTINKTYGQYRLNLTRHIQRLLDGDHTATKLYLTDYPYTSSYNSNGVRRSLLFGPHYSADDPNKNMRLLISYSY